MSPVEAEVRITWNSQEDVSFYSLPASSFLGDSERTLCHVLYKLQSRHKQMDNVEQHDAFTLKTMNDVHSDNHLLSDQFDYTCANKMANVGRTARTSLPYKVLLKHKTSIIPQVPINNSDKHSLTKPNQTNHKSFSQSIIIEKIQS